MKRSIACLPAALLLAATLNAQENGGQISLLNGVNNFTNSSSKDSVYFLKGGINLGVQGNYFWKSIGVAGRVGYFNNNTNEEKLASFAESRKASAERALIATKPYKGFYFMAGPAFQTTFSRWQVESNVLGGMFHHDDGGIYIGDRAQPDLVYYRNKIDAGSAFAWNVGFGVNYAISSPIRLGISADYLSTQSSVVNTDINRNNGTATQSLTSQANFLSTALKLTYSLNKSSHYDNRNTWKKSTVKSTSSNPGKVAAGNNGKSTPQNNSDCECENKVRDILFLDPLTVDITFTNLDEAQNFLKSNNPLYQGEGMSGTNPLHTKRDQVTGLATGRRQHKPAMANYDDVTNTFELNGKYYVPTTREAGSGLATGRRQHLPLKSAMANDDSNDGAIQGMMVRNAAGEQVFAVLPPRIDLQRVSYLEGGAISVHVKNENAQQKVADHNSSRSNKSSSMIDNGGNNEGNGQNTLRAQNNNTVRSNRTDNALKGGQEPDNSGSNAQQKVADHNSSRSNKSSSLAEKDTTGDQNNNTTREAGSGLATGRRQHYPLKAEWNETDDIIVVGDASFANIKSPRDASSGMATGKRSHKPITAMFDENTNTLELNNEFYTVLTPRDASSGLATGRRQHKPMTVMFDEENDEIDINGTIYKEVKTARETGSGMATGKRNKTQAWGDPHVDTKDGTRMASTENSVVYRVNNTKPIRCSNGQCELLCTVVVDGKEHEAVVTAKIKATHEMQMGSIRNLK